MACAAAKDDDEDDEGFKNVDDEVGHVVERADKDRRFSPAGLFFPYDSRPSRAAMRVLAGRTMTSTSTPVVFSSPADPLFIPTYALPANEHAGTGAHERRMELFDRCQIVRNCPIMPLSSCSRI